MQYRSMLDSEAQAFTRKQTARIWNVSEGLVIKIDAAGHIKTIQIGRRKLVPRIEVERVLQEGIADGSCPSALAGSSNPQMDAMQQGGTNGQ